MCRPWGYNGISEKTDAPSNKLHVLLSTFQSEVYTAHALLPCSLNSQVRTSGFFGIPREPVLHTAMGARRPFGILSQSLFRQDTQSVISYHRTMGPEPKSPGLENTYTVKTKQFGQSLGNSLVVTVCTYRQVMRKRSSS